MITRITVDFQGGLEALQAVADRAKSLQPVYRKVPRLIRFGSGSLQQQIAQRTFHDLAGNRRGWREAPYAVGRPRTARVSALEDVMWRAALATGPGSITRVSSREVSIGVNDAVVRQVSGQLGNQITPTQPYFPFVTGSFAERTTPAPARWTKRARLGRGRSRGGDAREFRADFYANISPYTLRLAAWWFIGLNYGRWLSEQEMRSGVPIPPKNMGWNPVLLERVRAAMLEHLIGGAVLARGRELDPRRAA